ncbi:MAG: methylenetetrahydrofolate reductase [NAD(P)H] [Ilumatobacteraceae bacterium]
MSFEVFPPKSADALDDLRSAVVRLNDASPAFLSVTYGAGGSDRERSFAAIEAVRSAGLDVAGHLTCVGQPRHDVDAVIDRYATLGVTQIVALRGDPPAGAGTPYEPFAGGYLRTADLVDSIKQRGGFDVAVSAYPERHPQSPTDDHDLDVLAEKCAAGADKAITQMFFDNGHYLRFRDRARARGIGIPIVPGIFPIHSFPAVARFASRCGASMPARIAERFAGHDDDPETTHKIATELATEQIAELVVHGVEQVHMYTLNRADLAVAVCQQLAPSNVKAA